MKDRSDDPSHERMLLPRGYLSLRLSDVIPLTQKQDDVVAYKAIAEKPFRNKLIEK